MACISHGKDGRWSIQFVGADGVRRTVCLGKVPGRDVDAKRVRVEAIRRYVEQLVYAQTHEYPVDSETGRWAARLEGKLADRLATLGLIAARVTIKRVLLGGFLDGIIASRKGDLKPVTLDLFRLVRKNLADFFGADRDLTSIGPGDAAGFRTWLAESEKLGRNTVARRVGFCRQFWKEAQRQHLIVDNPFAGMPSAVRADPSRFHFVTRQEADVILAACSDVRWKLTFLLARYGGMRPSEILLLRWADVNWERSRITVHSPKTERHEGKGERIIPLFPELQVPLLNAFNAAPEGSERVIQHAYAGKNMGTGLAAIIRKAGVLVWPKLFCNLRASRAIELADSFPAHVCTEWMGHSQQIAERHYLHSLDCHYDRACAAEALQQVNVVECESVQNGKNVTPHSASRSNLHAVATSCVGDTGVVQVAT